MSAYTDWLGRQPTDDTWPAWHDEGARHGWPNGWDRPDAIAPTPMTQERADELAGPPPADDQGAPRIYSVAELAALPSADESFIVAEGILTRGGKLLVHGASGVGKTTLAHDLLGCLATGTPWLGRYGIDAPRRVLAVQGELSLPEMASHAQQMVAAGYDAPGLSLVRMTGLRLPEGEAELVELVRRSEASVVLLDPWYRLFTGESSNQPEQVDRVFSACDRLLDGGVVEAVVVVHHSNVTGQRTAGSWIFEGWPSTILMVETVPGIPSQRLVKVQKVRAPSSELNGAQLRLHLGESGYRPVAPIAPEGDAGPTIASQVVADAGGLLSRADLVERLMARAGCRERAAGKYLGQAVQAGRLSLIKDGKRTLYRSAEADL